MRRIPFFDRNPNGQGWLYKLNLRPNELVQVNGRTYRFLVEKEGRELVLTPVEERK